MTLEELSRQPALDQTAETMLETLQKAGLKATATTQTLGDIAKDNNMLPTEVYKLLAPAAKKGTGQGQQQGQQKKELQKEGFGRKTLEQVAEEKRRHIHIPSVALKQPEHCSRTRHEHARHHRKKTTSP